MPQVVDANELEWEDQSAILYLVMEWIAGPTLIERVQRGSASIEEALSATDRIALTLGRCHKLEIHHRDLKPDNIILRDSFWGQPVLVDFGMSWSKPPENGQIFLTPNAQELGNRFLRLPEFAPGGDHHDNRSDVTMTVGLLFFMLCGCYPRTLSDHEGRFPHEAHQKDFPTMIVMDRRWPIIKRLFHVAFQTRIEARVQSIDDLRQWIVKIFEDPVNDFDGDLEREIAQLNDIFESEEGRRLSEIQPAMLEMNERLCSRLTEIIARAGLQAGGSNAVFKHAGQKNEFHRVVSKAGLADPSVVIWNRVEFINDMLVVSNQFDSQDWNVYYSGAAADPQGFLEDVESHASRIASEIIRRLRDKHR